jgi:hypothetical protein
MSICKGLKKDSVSPAFASALLPAGFPQLKI